MAARSRWRNAHPDPEGTFAVFYSGHSPALQFGLADVEQLVIGRVRQQHERRHRYPVDQDELALAWLERRYESVSCSLQVEVTDALKAFSHCLNAYPNECFCVAICHQLRGLPADINESRVLGPHSHRRRAGLPCRESVPSQRPQRGPGPSAGRQSQTLCLRYPDNRIPAVFVLDA